MFSRLLILFIIVPLLDLMLLLTLAKYLTWQVTVLTVVVSGIVGAWLASRQGRAVKGKIRDQMMQNQMPSGLLTDGAMILFAAGLLITPGLITDAFGFSLLIGPIRNWYKKMVSGWFKRNFKFVQMSPTENPFQNPFQNSAQDPNVVDGEILDRETFEPEDADAGMTLEGKRLSGPDSDD